MAPAPARPPMTPCPDCARPNDPDRGATSCIGCGSQLSAPWGGDYLTNNPPATGEST